MCLETTYVLCREHIAFGKFIKYACEGGKNMTVKMVPPTQWKHFVMLATPCGFMCQNMAARPCPLSTEIRWVLMLWYSFSLTWLIYNTEKIVSGNFFFLKKDFIYLFLDRGEGKEKKRERNINVWLLLTCPLLGTWPTTQAYALIANQTSDPLVCRPTLNLLSYTSQGYEW